MQMDMVAAHMSLRSGMYVLLPVCIVTMLLLLRVVVDTLRISIQMICVRHLSYITPIEFLSNAGTPDIINPSNSGQITNNPSNALSASH
jgi:hypothetical protein